MTISHPTPPNAPHRSENKLRLAIVSALMTVESLDFAMLKRVTGGTDGNISIQAKKLEEWGYITTAKEFIDRKPKTTYRITSEGQTAFRKYVALLAAVVKEDHS